MERRTFLSLLTAAPAAAVLAACGSDNSGGPVTTDPPLPPVTTPTTTVPPDTTPVAIDDETAIFEFGWYGGFTTRDVAFQQQPQVLVTSSGRLITPAPTAAIYPGPLLPADTVQSISDVGIERLLAAARDAGLLADLSYESNENIADASTATLRLTVDGETFVHEAYALGIGGGGLGGDFGTDLAPQRQAFADFVALLGDLPALVGPEHLGPPEPYEPSGYQLVSGPAGDLSSYEPEPIVLEWPSGSGVMLAEAISCVEVEAAAVGDVFSSATQLTFFVEDGATYQVVARPAYPGRAC